MTTTDYQFFFTPGKPEESFGIAAAQIAGVKPALALRRGEPDAVVVGIVEIALKDVRAADADYAGFVGLRIAQPLPVFIQHHGTHVLPRQTHANRARTQLAFHRADRRSAHAFGQAIAFQYAQSALLLKATDQFCWHGRGTADGSTERADIPVAKGHLQQCGINSRHTGIAINPVGGNDFPEARNQPRRAETRRRGQQHVAATGEGGQSGSEQRIDMEQRQSGQYGAATAEHRTADSRIQLASEDHFVMLAVAGNLRQTGGATGTEVSGNIVSLWRIEQQFIRRGGFQQVVKTQ